MPSKKKYYVYRHVDPNNGDLVYIGKGCGGRAWDVTRSRGYNNKHQQWMQKLSDLGHTPEEWVEILFKGLTEQEAFKKETELLNTQLTLFNRQTGERQHQSKMTNAQARWAYVQAVVQNKTHASIADVLGVSRSSISMLVSGRQWKAVTKDLREKFNDNNV